MNSLTTYLKSVEANHKQGNATEHTHRPALKELIESLEKGIRATNEPKRINCGAPDFIITKGEVPLGYVEAKDVGESLGKVEITEQLKRYRESLGNLILTDYLEFRWFVGGEPRLTASLGEYDAGKKKLTQTGDGINQVAQLFKAFFDADPPVINNPKQLAERMARLAKLIRETIEQALEDEDKGDSLHAQMEGFRRVLLHDLKRDEFADMYAQTICYGLFAARCNHNSSDRFTRKLAPYQLPKTNPFLRETFGNIAGAGLDDRIAWAVDDLAELLHRTDIEAILKNFGKRTKQEDPVVHFYESFLSAYDPKMREGRGVYYTPEPVVSYIVRSVDHLLKTEFNLPEGLADATKIKIKTAEGEERETHKVQILDPATGTGTFLHGVIDQIHENFIGNKGMWSGYVKDHLLPRIFGFELLMAPYTVAHMKLDLQLAETGYEFDSDERLRVYLTNTLEEAFGNVGTISFADWLTKEANAASEIKQEEPVMVILGNPPYSGHSVNSSAWITDLLHGVDSLRMELVGNYFVVDGKPLGEKNSKWINDDYVKFIRFAQWRIEKTGHGILAFITNHGYLDNPTFRGMRQSLLKTFDKIFILDLHGNLKKKEKSPDGTKDENVFDIQQGVTMGFFIKLPIINKDLAEIYHSNLWGLRKDKYNYLSAKSVESTDWKLLTPSTPNYLFIPQNIDRLAEYNLGDKITNIMPVNGVGMTTARDNMVIDFEEDKLVEKAKTFRDSTLSDDELCSILNIPLKQGWNISNARLMIKGDKDLHRFIRKVLYRPFDNRLIFYHDSLVWRTVKKIMSNMELGNNLGFAIGRAGQVIDQGIWNIIFCTRYMTEFNLFRRGGNCLFPLLVEKSLLPKDIITNIHENNILPSNSFDMYPNLATDFVKAICEKLDLKFINDGKGDLIENWGPEDIFNYMYSVFHSPTYRTRYAEFLKIDFPRLPLTSNIELFRKLCAFGEELVGLHLMERSGKNIPKYPISGDSTVDVVRYAEPMLAGVDAHGGRVFINQTQFFEGVAPQVWAFHIGGYQVCQKWLKDRKGRKLSYDDKKHYMQTVAALSETIRLMGEIDTVIDAHGGFPIG